ncbi:conserved Plasmodium protein, unknown function [Plasmodium gallinaceum]|uniref:Uncharacterized protein n=1 Tax=Plasmodium gallinaceum TaxID=5849 RepID=A0A1J1GZ90_PLAGA|nr:conserved Plasmodium protein, unknown function [Plasmodium gallinaceum]CRG97623.1 conserved Plasmodium protein, unknown function [Plasmodium gallinaceum]
MADNHASMFLFTVQGILASVTCCLCCFIYAYCYNNKLFKNENIHSENKNKRNISKLKIDTEDDSTYKKRNVEKEHRNDFDIKDSLNERVYKNEIIKSETNENNVISLKSKLNNNNKTSWENESLKNNYIEEISTSENICKNIDSGKLICDTKYLNNEENNFNQIILSYKDYDNLSSESTKIKEFNNTYLKKNISNNFHINYDKNENKNSNSFIGKNYTYEEERKKHFNITNKINKNYLFNKLYLFDNNEERNVDNFPIEVNTNMGNCLNINKNNSNILTSDNISHINEIDNHIISNIYNNNNDKRNRIEYNPKFNVIEKDEFTSNNYDIKNNLYLSKPGNNEKSYNRTLNDKFYIKEKNNLRNKCDEQSNYYRNELNMKINEEKYKGRNYFNSTKEIKNYTNEFKNCKKKNDEISFKEQGNIDNLSSPNNSNYFGDTNILTKYDENITFKNYKKKYLLDVNKPINSKINNKKKDNIRNSITYQNKQIENNSDPSKYNIKSSNIFFSSNESSKDNSKLCYIHSLNNYNNKTNHKNLNSKEVANIIKDIDNSNNNNNNRSNSNSCYNIIKVKHLNTCSNIHSNFINFDKTNKVQHKLMYNYNDINLLKSKRKTSLPSLSNFINEENCIPLGNLEVIKNENNKNNMIYIDEQKCSDKHDNTSFPFEFEKKEKFRNRTSNESSIDNFPDIQKNLLSDLNKKYVNNDSNIKSNFIFHSDSSSECINKKVVDDNIYLPDYDIKKKKNNEKCKNSNIFFCHKMNSINDYITPYNSNCDSYKKFEDKLRKNREFKEKEYLKSKENSDFHFLTDENTDESMEKKIYFNEINLKNTRRGKLSSSRNIITLDQKLHFKKIDNNISLDSLNCNKKINYEEDGVNLRKYKVTDNLEENRKNELNVLNEDYESDLEKKEIDEYKKSTEIKEIIRTYLQNSKNVYNLKNSDNYKKDDEQQTEEYNQDENTFIKENKNQNNKKRKSKNYIHNFSKMNLNNNEKSKYIENCVNNEKSKYIENCVNNEKSNCIENCVNNEKSNYIENCVNNEQMKNQNYYEENKKDNSFEKNISENKDIIKIEYDEKDDSTFKNNKNNNGKYLKNEKNNSNIFFVKKEQKRDTNILCDHLRRSNRVKNEKNKKWNKKNEDNERFVFKKNVKYKYSKINEKAIKKEEIFQKKKKISKTQPVELKIFKEQIFLNDKNKLKELCQEFNTIDENRCASGFANFLMQHIQKKEDMENFDDILNFTLKLKNSYDMKTVDFIEAFLILETIDLSVIRMYPIKEWILVTFHYLKGNLTNKNLKLLIKSLKLDNLIISNVTACFYMNKKQIKITEKDIRRIFTILSDIVIRRSSRIKKSKNSNSKNKCRDKQNKDEILGSCWHPVNTNISTYKK